MPPDAAEEARSERRLRFGRAVEAEGRSAMRATGQADTGEVRRIVGARGLRQSQVRARQVVRRAASGFLQSDGSDQREVRAMVLRGVREGVGRRWRSVDRVEEGECLQESHRSAFSRPSRTRFASIRKTRTTPG